MKQIKHYFLLALWIPIFVIASGCDGSVLPQYTELPPDAHYHNARLGRGVNLGNALEAPNYEGEWGIQLREAYFEEISQAGFDSVRLPVRWSAHADMEPPYALDADFLARVDWAIAQAQSRGLIIVLNIHHYDELIADPEAHRDRFVGIWKQLATHYQDFDDTLYFELLNEPNANLTARLWNEYLTEALAVIRETNPQRPVVIGPTEWNNIRQLHALELPEDDRNIIVTFHYYEPFQFTHQGAEWINGSEPWLGTEWSGSVGDRQAVIEALKVAVRWAEQENRPLYMGEFGAYSRADITSRERWTAFMREQAETQGISWAYWEFAAGFGIYDPVTEQWREALLTSLMPKSP